MIETFEDVSTSRCTYQALLRPCECLALDIAWSKSDRARRGHSFPTAWPRAIWEGVSATGAHPNYLFSGTNIGRGSLALDVSIFGMGWQVDQRLFNVLALWGAAMRSIMRRSLRIGALEMARRGLLLRQAQRVIVPRLCNALRARRSQLEAEARVPEESRGAMARAKTLDIHRGNYASSFTPSNGDYEDARLRARSLDL